MKRENAAGRVADLATAEPYERALLTLRGYAADLLNTGYPRDELYRDFERARGVLQGRGASGAEEAEEAEDTVLDAMDFLAGFSSTRRLQLQLHEALGPTRGSARHSSPLGASS